MSQGVLILTVMSRINSVYSVVQHVRAVVMVLVLIKESEVSLGLFLSIWILFLMLNSLI